MNLKSIKLKNLTVFENLKVDLARGVNIFIGRNGTGKTHLLKAVYAACEVSKIKSDGRLNPSRKRKLVCVSGKISITKRTSGGNSDVEKNVPHKKLIGIKRYVLTCASSSYVWTFNAAQKQTLAKIIEFNTTTLRKFIGFAKKFRFAPKSTATPKINAVEINARTTADEIFPITNANGSIGALRYSSKLL